MIDCAFLSCPEILRGASERSTSGNVTDDSLLLAPLREVGIEPTFISWDQADVDWSRFRAAVVRTTWDYTGRLNEFLSALARIQTQTQLWNPLSIIQWNCKKTYLKALAEKGFSVIPTQLLKASSGGEPCDRIEKAFEDFASEQVVVKPLVGAGSVSTFFLSRDQVRLDREKLDRLLNGKEFLIQPLVSEIRNGEISLHFFSHQFSHGVRKVPAMGAHLLR